jgi:hypothetical protein
MTSLKTLYGLFFVALLAIVSHCLVSLPWMAETGISSLVVAIILGILMGNLWHHPDSWSPGIQFAAKPLLRTAQKKTVVKNLASSFPGLLSVLSWSLDLIRYKYYPLP